MMTRLLGAISRYYPLIALLFLIVSVIQLIVELPWLITGARAMLRAGGWVYPPLALIGWGAVLLGLAHDKHLWPRRLMPKPLAAALDRLTNSDPQEEPLPALTPAPDNTVIDARQRWPKRSEPK